MHTRRIESSFHLVADACMVIYETALVIMPLIRTQAAFMSWISSSSAKHFSFDIKLSQWLGLICTPTSRSCGIVK